MSSWAIITVITLAIVSCLVIGLIVLSYWVILKSARKVSASGGLDKEFIQEVEDSKKPSKRILGIVLQAVSGVLCVGLVTLALISGIYRAKGKQFVANNHVSLAVATDSMEKFYDDDYKQELVDAYCLAYSVEQDKALFKIEADQFEVGDLIKLAVVNGDEELHFYDIYGYKNKDGLIITHRLLGIHEDGTLIFRGDNAPGEDIRVTREQVLYHYQGSNAKHIGLVVLFFGSGYGIYAICAVIAVSVVSDVAIYKWEKIKNARLAELGIETKKPKKKKAEKDVE